MEITHATLHTLSYTLSVQLRFHSLQQAFVFLNTRFVMYMYCICHKFYSLEQCKIKAKKQTKKALLTKWLKQAQLLPQRNMTSSGKAMQWPTINMQVHIPCRIFCSVNAVFMLLK